MADYIVRATAANAQIRAFATTTRETVEEARKAHDSSPVITAALGRLLTAGAMMGSMLKGEKDVLTLQIRCSGPAKGLTVTADSQANVKGSPMEPHVMLPPNAQGKPRPTVLTAFMSRPMLWSIPRLSMRQLHPPVPKLV